MKGDDQTTGFDHVGHHHQLILPPGLQDIPFRHPKTESSLGLRQPASPTLLNPNQGCVWFKRKGRRNGAPWWSGTCMQNCALVGHRFHPIAALLTLTAATTQLRRSFLGAARI
jgi:hypothetical protein